MPYGYTSVTLVLGATTMNVCVRWHHLLAAVLQRFKCPKTLIDPARPLSIVLLEAAQDDTARQKRQ